MDLTAFLTEEDIVIHEFKGALPRRLQRRLGKGDSRKVGSGTKIKGGIGAGPGKPGIGHGKNGSTSKGIGTPKEKTLVAKKKTLVAKKKTLVAKKVNKTNDKTSSGKSTNSIPRKPKKPKATLTKAKAKSDKVQQLKDRMRAMAVKLMNRAKVCPKKHKLKQFSGEEDGYSCNLCSKYFDEVYGCRICDWDACEKCLKSRSSKNEDSSSSSGSKKGLKVKKSDIGKKKEEDDICWDYMKGSCRMGSRCKWKHVDEPLDMEMSEMDDSWGRGDRWETTSRDGWSSSSRYGFEPYSTAYNPYVGSFDKPVNSALIRNSGLSSAGNSDYSVDYSVGEDLFEGLYRRPKTRPVSGYGNVEALMFNSQHLAGPRMDEKMCWNFLEGKCRLGADCKWSHEFQEDEIDKYVEKEVSCPVCSQMFYSYDGLEQHQEAKLHYPPETLAKIREVMKKNKQKRKPRSDDSKDHEWGDWEKHGTGVGSKLLKKWGFEDRLGKSKVGPINPIILDVRRKNTGLGFAGWKKRKRIKDDPLLHQIITNGTKRHKKNEEKKKIEKDQSGELSQVPMDYSQLNGGDPDSLPKKQGSKVKKAAKKKWINNSKNKKGGKNKKSAAKNKKPAKGEKGFDICWNFKKGTCKNGKCKWKHS